MSENKKQFVYIYKPFKDDFNNTATDKENAVIGEHFLYLKKLLDDGILILAGPETNARFGIAIIETDTEQEAKEIMENDPAVMNSVFTAELFPYRVSLIRK